MHHGRIELFQAMIAELRVVSDRPEPPGVGIRPAVPLAREVNPLWVTEFIAHEIEVAAPAGGCCDKANQLVQCNAPVHYWVRLILAHAEVHFLVDEAEDYGFVSHQCLVVALGIAYRLLIGALVGKLPPYSAHAPLLVREFLDPFDPVVGNAHCHPEVESYASGLEGSGQTGHSAHIFGNGESLGVDLVNQHIGQPEVGHRVLINALVEIQRVVTEVGTEAVVPVQHAGHSVEAESVQVILFHPVFAVGEQEVFHFVLAIIEAACAPGRVMSRRARIEVQVFPAVQQAKAFGFIAHGVRMDYIHDDGYTCSMGFIHQPLELFRSAEAGTQREEARYLITEGAVVRMLLQRHDLQGVVAKPLDSRQHGTAEVIESGHGFFLTAHAYVALVDERMRPGPGPAMLPLVRSRIPDLGAENLCVGVLHHACCVGRDALSPTAWPLYPQFVQGSVA